MARVGRRSRLGRMAEGGRRAAPLIMAAWERWQALPEEEKERYRRKAREYALRARRAVEQAQSRRRRAVPALRRRSSRLR